MQGPVPTCHHRFLSMSSSLPTCNVLNLRTSASSWTESSHTHPYTHPLSHRHTYTRTHYTPNTRNTTGTFHPTLTFHYNNTFRHHCTDIMIKIKSLIERLIWMWARTPSIVRQIWYDTVEHAITLSDHPHTSHPPCHSHQNLIWIPLSYHYRYHYRHLVIHIISSSTTSTRDSNTTTTNRSNGRHQHINSHQTNLNYQTSWN